MAYPDSQVTLKSLFTKYQDDSLLLKLESYALWTIPSVFPTDVNVGEHRNAEIEYDCQSKGALVVNRLATKLARTLFPANTSFFRIEVNDKIKDLFKQQEIDNIITYENKACARIFLNASYAQIVQALRLLIITGECLLYRMNESIRVYSLRDYSVKRNNVGEVLDIIIQELKYYSELPEKVQGLVGDRSEDTKLKMYTRCKLVKNGAWEVTQEIEGQDIGTRTTYRNKLCPYIPVTWNFVNGDNYGRGYVEDYAADLFKYSELSRALADYELESLRLIHLYNPAGIFDVKGASEAESGDWVQGDPQSTSPYEAGDYQKMMQISADLQQVADRLDVAFMYTGNTRDGERVKITALIKFS